MGAGKRIELVTYNITQWMTVGEYMEWMCWLRAVHVVINMFTQSHMIHRCY